LDGSSNIECLVSIGSIFGIAKKVCNSWNYFLGLQEYSLLPRKFFCNNMWQVAASKN
jgi:hypothetical protein